MDQPLDIFSPRAENALKATLANVGNYSAEAGSTKQQGLKGAEHAAVMANMSRPQFLALCIYFQINVTLHDIEELQGFIITNYVMQQSWYTQGSYLSQSHLANRLDGLTAAAIKNLSPLKAEQPTSAQVAQALGISTSALNKTTKHGDNWAQRYQAACRYLQDELETAAQVVHNNSRASH